MHKTIIHYLVRNISMRSLLLILPLALLISCSVQKRRYLDGFYVERLHKKIEKKQDHANTSKKESLTIKALDQRIDPALRSHETELLRTIKKLEEPSKAALPPDSCDVLVFRDGSEIQSKVQEVGVSEVKYKRCDNLEGPTYMTKKSDLFMIKFANGTREVMKAEPQVQKPMPAASPGRQPLNRSRQRVTDSQAVSGLVAAIASIVLALISMFIFIPAYAVLLLLASLILAISAIVLSKRAMNRIKEQPDIYKGKGLAIPANIIGWIMVGIYALTALIILLIFLTI